MFYHWKKILHLIKGLPGSGKSTLALNLVGGDYRKVVENDDYWFIENNPSSDSAHKGPYEHHLINRAYEKYGNPPNHPYVYSYDTCLTALAGNWCGAEAFRRLRIFDEVAVANTFVKRYFILQYIEQARSLGIRVKLHEAQSPWSKDPKQCFEKNVHGVPLEVIEKMLADWEDMTQAEVDILLNLPQDLR